MKKYVVIEEVENKTKSPDGAYGRAEQLELYLRLRPIEKMLKSRIHKLINGIFS